MRLKGFSLPTFVISSTFLLSAPLFVGAGEIDFQPSLTAEYVYFESERDNQLPSEFDNRTYVVEPSLRTLYQSTRVDGFWLVDHREVMQEKDALNGEDLDESYTNSAYGAQARLIENMLSVQVAGNLSYRGSGQRGTFVADEFLSPSDLIRVRTNSALVNFQIPNNRYIQIAWQGNFSKAEAEQATDSATNFDNDSFGARTTISQGREFKAIGWDFDVQWNKTKREGFQDLLTRRTNGRVSAKLASSIRAIAVTERDEYQFDTSDFAVGRANLDTVVYGAGLSWQPSDQRRFDLTYNSIEEGINATEYVGVDFDWAFSPRTSASGSYGRRFYGDSYAFSLSHNRKHLRVTGQYSEEVTTFARLNSITNDLGVFVCQAGEIELASCFQPDTLSYELEADEQFISFLDFDSEINEEVQLRKVGSITLGYELRKLSISLTATHSDIEFLETGLTRQSESYQAAASYQLSRRTTASVTLGQSIRDFSESNSEDQTSTVNTSIRRNFSESLSISVAYRYLDRSSSDDLFNLTDNRFTTKLVYSF